MRSSAPGASRTTSISTAQFVKLKNVRAKPKPYGGTRPIIMNAGSSPAGQAFALRNCDAFFVATAGSRTSLDGNARKVAEIKSAARGYGREIEVYTVGQVICRPTPAGGRGLLPARHHRERRLGRDRRHAGDQEHHAADAVAGGIRRQAPLLRRATPSAATRSSARPIAWRKSFRTSATPACGGSRSPSSTTCEELPYFCDEVLPRLARLGTRAMH